MNNSSEFCLNGTIDLKIDKYHIKIECEGNCVKLLFTSFYSLTKFVYSSLALKKQINDHFFDNLYINYYLGDKLIAKSNSKLPQNWFLNYLGMEKFEFYLKPFLSFIFSKKK